MSWRGLRRLGPWWLAAALTGIGLLVVALGAVRPGGYLVAASFAVAAATRAVLPPPRSGGLRVRRTWVDVVSLLGLAVLVAVAFALVRLEV